MFTLRPYQALVRAATYEAWERFRSVLAIVPTGGGKTVIFSSIIHDHNGAAIAIVHRREIVSQISMSLASLGVVHRVIAPPKTVRQIRRKQLAKFGRPFLDDYSDKAVASVQTLTSPASESNALLQRFIRQCSLCVFDEGHHYVTEGIWSKAVTMMASAKLLFVTATPERADGKGLGTAELGGGGFCEVMVEGPPTRWLIDQGFLCDYVYKAPDTDLNLEGLATNKAGDFNASALRARVVESHIVGDVVQHYYTFAPGRRGIVFATDVATAYEIAEKFQQSGAPAVALHGGTDSDERERVLLDFEAGRVQILVNVDLFDEGFDVPAVECVLMARPTQSLAKYLQMIGRALRIMEGKSRAVIIDPVRNWERHGIPTLPRTWSLAGRDKRARSASDDMVDQIVCKSCTQPYEAFYKACPYCGVAPVISPADRSAPEFVHGDLFELDTAAMEALFTKHASANQTAADYEVALIGRNVPPDGRPRMIRIHQTAKYRREVLKNLVGWWVGAQQNKRDLSEIYRRFYLRFGVDIMTAHSLDAPETDALIEKITNLFSKDI